MDFLKEGKTTGFLRPFLSLILYSAMAGYSVPVLSKYMCYARQIAERYWKENWSNRIGSIVHFICNRRLTQLFCERNGTDYEKFDPNVVVLNCVFFLFLES